MNMNGLIVLVIIVTCAAACRLGQSGRKSGRGVSPRVTITLMAAAWALSWLAIGLPSMLDGSLMTLSERLHNALALLAFASTPLIIILAAGWLPRLNAGMGQKTFKPHPLD